MTTIPVQPTRLRYGDYGAREGGHGVAGGVEPIAVGGVVGEHCATAILRGRTDAAKSKTQAAPRNERLGEAELAANEPLKPGDVGRCRPPRVASRAVRGAPQRAVDRDDAQDF